MKLKDLSPQAIPVALEKAELYRLLNEPAEAESICLDILRIEAENQRALVTLLLSLTDQYRYGDRGHTTRAQDIIPQLKDPYERIYYSGIVAERRAKAVLDRHQPNSESMAYELFREAMNCFEQAEAIRPTGNDDALLRWNTCVRIIERRKLSRAPEEQYEPPLE